MFYSWYIWDSCTAPRFPDVWKRLCCIAFLRRQLHLLQRWFPGGSRRRLQRQRLAASPRLDVPSSRRRRLSNRDRWIRPHVCRPRSSGLFQRARLWLFDHVHRYHAESRITERWWYRRCSESSVQQGIDRFHHLHPHHDSSEVLYSTFYIFFDLNVIRIHPSRSWNCQTKWNSWSIYFSVCPFRIVLIDWIILNYWHMLSLETVLEQVTHHSVSWSESFIQLVCMGVVCMGFFCKSEPIVWKCAVGFRCDYLCYALKWILTGALGSKMPVFGNTSADETLIDSACPFWLGTHVWSPSGVRHGLLLRGNHHRPQLDFRCHHRHVRRSEEREAAEGGDPQEHVLHLRYSSYLYFFGVF